MLCFGDSDGIPIGVGVGIGIGIERAHEVCGTLSTQENVEAKRVLDRIVAMLTKLGQRHYSVNEDPSRYGAKADDSDSDTDSDPEKR